MSAPTLIAISAGNDHLHIGSGEALLDSNSELIPSDTTLLSESGVNRNNTCYEYVAGLIVAGIVFCRLCSTIVAEDLLTSDTNLVFMVYFNVGCDTSAWIFYFATQKWGKRFRMDVEGVYTQIYVAQTAITLMLLYQVGNVLYFLGLKGLSVSTVMIIDQTSNAVVYGLSLLLLSNENFCWRRLSAVGATLLGVGMISADAFYHDTDKNESPALQIAILLVSSVLSALYEVLFKRWLGEANTVDSFLFIGVRGLSNIAFLWPLVFLYSAQSGQGELLQNGMWGGLAIMAVLSVCLTLCITLGETMHHPRYTTPYMSSPAAFVYI
jgi:drug/metabolite transporter (DMT)-like permease